MTVYILATGSRHHRDRAFVAAQLHPVAERHPDATLLHGNAPGLDTLAHNVWRYWGLPVLGMSAYWNDPCNPETCDHGGRRRRQDGSTYCPAAGNYRNQRMVDLRPLECHAFPLGASIGTRDCARRATEAGISVEWHTPTTELRQRSPAQARFT